MTNFEQQSESLYFLRSYSEHKTCTQNVKAAVAAVKINNLNFEITFIR